MKKTVIILSALVLILCGYGCRLVKTARANYVGKIVAIHCIDENGNVLENGVLSFQPFKICVEVEAFKGKSTQGEGIDLTLAGGDRDLLKVNGEFFTKNDTVIQLKVGENNMACMQEFIMFGNIKE